MGDELPGLAGIRRSVEVDLSDREVGRDRASSQENRAALVACEGFLKHIQEGLVPQPPAVDSILHPRAFRPSVAAVCGVEDGEVDLGRLGGVVLPCCDQGAVFQLGGAGVEDFGVGPVCVGGRGEDFALGKGCGSLAWFGVGGCEGEGEEGEEEGGELHCGEDLGWVVVRTCIFGSCAGGCYIYMHVN